MIPKNSSNKIQFDPANGCVRTLGASAPAKNNSRIMNGSAITCNQTNRWRRILPDLVLNNQFISRGDA